MGEDVVKLTENERLQMWCPGCKRNHIIPFLTDFNPNGWNWNYSKDKPTISPSILVYGSGGHHPRCHSFIFDGEWRFLNDCEHDLAGQTVKMVSVHEWPDNATT